MVRRSDGVEVGERLVEQQELRLLDQGARQRDALLLPARHLGRLALQELLDLNQARRLARPLLGLGRRDSRLKRSGKRMFSRAVMCG